MLSHDSMFLFFVVDTNTAKFLVPQSQNHVSLDQQTKQLRLMPDEIVLTCSIKHGMSIQN